MIVEPPGFRYTLVLVPLDGLRVVLPLDGIRAVLVGIRVRAVTLMIAPSGLLLEDAFLVPRLAQAIWWRDR